MKKQKKLLKLLEESRKVKERFERFESLRKLHKEGKISDLISGKMLFMENCQYAFNGREFTQNLICVEDGYLSATESIIFTIKNAHFLAEEGENFVVIGALRKHAKYRFKILFTDRESKIRFLAVLGDFIDVKLRKVIPSKL